MEKLLPANSDFTTSKKKEHKKKTHIFNKISKQLLSVVFSGVFQWGLFGQWETNGTFVTRPEEAEEHV